MRPAPRRNRLEGSGVARTCSTNRIAPASKQPAVMGLALLTSQWGDTGYPGIFVGFPRATLALFRKIVFGIVGGPLDVGRQFPLASAQAFEWRVSTYPVKMSRVWPPPRSRVVINVQSRASLRVVESGLSTPPKFRMFASATGASPLMLIV